MVTVQVMVFAIALGDQPVTGDDGCTHLVTAWWDRAGR